MSGRPAGQEPLNNCGPGKRAASPVLRHRPPSRRIAPMRYLPFVFPGALIAALACGTDTAVTDGAGDTTTGSTSGSASGSTSGTSDTPTTTDGREPVDCTTPPHFAAGLQPTASLHVAEDGSDGPGCGTEAAPCRTI